MRQPAGSTPETPAENARTPNAASSAGSTYTIELPAGMKLLSQNQRIHHMERYRRGEALKKAAWALALKAKIPPLGYAEITVEYQPSDNRDNDPDNVPPASGKPCIDGLVAAGVLPDDSKRYVASVGSVIGPVYPRGRLRLIIREVGTGVWQGGAA